MAVRPVILRAGCGVVVAGMLILLLRAVNWRLAIHAMAHIRPTALALALAASVVSMMISGVLWACVLRCMGYRAPIRVGLAVFAGTGLAAYAGTSAGAVAACVMLLRRRGVCGGHAALLISIASMIGFCGSLVWAPCGVALLNAPAALRALPELGRHGPLIAIGATIFFAAGTLFALWLITLAHRLGPRWRITRLVAHPSAPPVKLHLHRLLALIPCAALAWLVGTGSLWVLVQAAAPGVRISLSSVIAVQSLAAVGGSVTFFLPNGLGARDGIIVALLSGVAGVPIPAAAAAALLVRVADPVAKALILLVIGGLGWSGARTVPAADARRAIADLLRAPTARRAPIVQ